MTRHLPGTGPDPFGAGQIDPIAFDRDFDATWDLPGDCARECPEERERPAHVEARIVAATFPHAGLEREEALAAVRERRDAAWVALGGMAPRGER